MENLLEYLQKYIAKNIKSVTDYEVLKLICSIIDVYQK